MSDSHLTILIGSLNWVKIPAAIMMISSLLGLKIVRQNVLQQQTIYAWWLWLWVIDALWIAWQASNLYDQAMLWFIAWMHALIVSCDEQESYIPTGWIILLLTCQFLYLFYSNSLLFLSHIFQSLVLLNLLYCLRYCWKKRQDCYRSILGTADIMLFIELAWIYPIPKLFYVLWFVMLLAVIRYLFYKKNTILLPLCLAATYQNCLLKLI